MRGDVKPGMVSSDDLVMWSGFPKGLRVLLLDRQSAAETRLKLEAMDYVVYSYYNEKEALEAVSDKAESFHVAIIEVTSGNSDESFRFLEMAKDLPTVVISDVCCLNTMMKCIALGAAEFIQKPLSDDKLRNIWQHVVQKAFNTGANLLSKSLKPVKETVASMLQLQPETIEHNIELPSEAEDSEKNQENACDDLVANEIFQQPSTPQLIQGGRLLNDEGCQERYNCSTERESTENTKSVFEQRDSESKSVDNTFNEPSDGIDKLEVSHHRVKEGVDDDEVDSAGGSKTDECGAFKEAYLPSSNTKSGERMESYADDPKKKNSLISTNSHSHGKKASRKRMKVDWTPELHRRFVQAVEQLGVDQAIPSKILELMSVEGITRHNVASHLQKFRMHRRHILPKDVDMRWQAQRDPASRGYVQKPIMAYPPYHSNYGLPQNQVYPVWGHPNYFTPTYQMWGNTGFQPWHPPLENWHWKGYHGIQADAWGCPMLPQYSQCSQIPPVVDDFVTSRDRGIVFKESSNPSPTKEVIDEVVKEAMNKPWLPLPIGLKPPSTDSILAELQRNGISTIPPSSTATTSYR